MRAKFERVKDITNVLNLCVPLWILSALSVTFKNLHREHRERHREHRIIGSFSVAPQCSLCNLLRTYTENTEKDTGDTEGIV